MDWLALSKFDLCMWLWILCIVAWFVTLLWVGKYIVSASKFSHTITSMYAFMFLVVLVAFPFLCIVELTGSCVVGALQIKSVLTSFASSTAWNHVKDHYWILNRMTRSVEFLLDPIYLGSSCSVYWTINKTSRKILDIFIRSQQPCEN